MYPKLIYLIVSIILAIGINGQSNDLDVDEVEKKVKEEFSNLQNTTTQEKLESLLKEKCRNSSGSDEAFDILQSHFEALKECIQDQLNVTQIKLEVEEAKKTGSMDEIFGKYCRNYPEIFKCVEETTDSLRACIDDDEKKNLDKAINVTNELKEFVCFKDGDRIAMFVAEGGVECLNSREEALQGCANKTLGTRIPTDFSLASIPKFVFSEEYCKDFHEFRTCVNTELEKCSDSTPANIVDAFFKFLKKHMPCVEDKKIVSAAVAASTNPSAADKCRSSTYSILVVFISLLIYKFSF